MGRLAPGRGVKLQALPAPSSVGAGTSPLQRGSSRAISENGPLASARLYASPLRRAGWGRAGNRSKALQAKSSG
eukprot:4165260-Alexandrium_andersonii.AAC.1